MVMLISCSRKNPSAEIKDQELLIQAMYQKAKNEGLEYQVRIFSLTENGKMDKKQLVEKMSYGIDSCFYIISTGIKKYPEAVIPVNSGIKNCFEYLLVFPEELNQVSEVQVLSYQDRFISGKTYQLSFK